MSDGEFIEPQTLGLAEAVPENKENSRYDNLTLKEARKCLEIDLIESSLDRNKGDRKSTRLNSSHIPLSRMPSSA